MKNPLRNMFKRRCMNETFANSEGCVGESEDYNFGLPFVSGHPPVPPVKPFNSTIWLNQGVLGRAKWDRRFLEMATLVGSWSKDPSTQVGAVIVDDNNRIISVGFNGMAQGVEDNPDRFEDKGFKHRTILHAEENAILFAQRDLTGCTIYISPMPACSKCTSFIIQSGIDRVVTYEVDEVREPWEKSFEMSHTMMAEAGVEYVTVKKET